MPDPARLLLPLSLELAEGTLRTLAARQGTAVDPATAEEPGKILHELRQSTFTMPGEGIELPPVYYGTVDATPLWIVLLHEAWRAGMPLEAVRELRPALEAALGWLRAKGTIPIASGSRPEQVEALMVGARLELSAEQIAQLDAASDAFEAARAA